MIGERVPVGNRCLWTRGNIGPHRGMQTVRLIGYGSILGDRFTGNENLYSSQPYQKYTHSFAFLICLIYITFLSWYILFMHHVPTDYFPGTGITIWFPKCSEETWWILPWKNNLVPNHKEYNKAEAVSILLYVYIRIYLYDLFIACAYMDCSLLPWQHCKQTWGDNYT